MVNLLYIASLGHSGSTILDLAVAAAAPDKVQSLGEFRNFTWQVHRLPKHYETSTLCSCHRFIVACPVWGKLIRENYPKMLNYPEKFQTGIYTDISIHYSKMESVRRKILKSTNGKVWEYAKKRYLESTEFNWSLFGLVGKEAVVDSSKDLLRFRFLHSRMPENAKLIVLIRSPHGVIATRDLPPEGRPKRLKFWLDFYNNQAFRIMKEIGPENYRVVWHEDFCMNPAKETQRILDLVSIQGNFPKDNTLYPPELHMVAGNDIRRLPELTIRKPSEQWKTTLNQNEIELADRYLDMLKSEYKNL